MTKTMKIGPGVVLVGLVGSIASACGGGGASDAPVTCPAGTEARLFVEPETPAHPALGATEHRWCAAPGEVPHGPSTRAVVGGPVLESGAFSDGLFDGAFVFRSVDDVLVAEQEWSDGREHGAWVSYDHLGRPRWHGRFAFGVQCGPWETLADGAVVSVEDYPPCDEVEAPVGGGEAPKLSAPALICGGGRTPFEDTALRVRGCLLDGVLDGPWRELDRGGDVRVAGQFIAGERAGRWQYVGAVPPYLGVEEHWLAGERHGERRVYARSGALVERAEWVTGALNGTLERFTPAGARVVRHAYASGQLHGPSTWYWPDGGVRLEEEWRDGLRHGESRAWHPGGSPAHTGAWREGRRDGTWTRFFPGGGALSEGAYANGYEDGEWRYFDSDGRPTLRQTFVAGLPTGGGTAWYYHDEHEATLSGAYVDGLRAGVWEGRWDTGERAMTIAYRMGEAQGPVEEWWPDGSPRLAMGFEAGLPHGELSAWYPSGALAVMGQYRLGRREGEWTFYDEHGEVTLALHYELALDQVFERLPVDTFAAEGW